MSIKRMLLLSSMALAAIAFAVPAVAQATVQLTENNKALKAGVEITATSTDLETATGTGTLSCELVTFHLEVVTNGKTHVVLKDKGITTKNCIVTGTTKTVTITDPTLLENLTINTWGTGIVNATFNSNVYDATDPTHTKGLLPCHFEGKVHVAATAASPTQVLGVGPSVLTAKGTGCTDGTITGTIKLETSNGTAVTLDYVKTG